MRCRSVSTKTVRNNHRKNHTDNSDPVLKTHSPRTVLLEAVRHKGWLVIAACLWVLVGLAVSSDPADSAAFNYNTSAQLHTINVGMLLLDSDNQTGPAGVDHAGWYSFYIL